MFFFFLFFFFFDFKLKCTIGRMEGGFFFSPHTLGRAAGSTGEKLCSFRADCSFKTHAGQFQERQLCDSTEVTHRGFQSGIVNLERTTSGEAGSGRDSGG